MHMYVCHIKTSTNITESLRDFQEHNVYVHGSTKTCHVSLGHVLHLYANDSYYLHVHIGL